MQNSLKFIFQQINKAYITRFIQHVVKRFIADNCQQHAAALTYMTLFSIVPLLSVLYAVLAWVPAFQEIGDQIRNFIFSNFVPSAGKEITRHLTDFSNQTRTLSGAGASILFVTVMLMMRNIEMVFNHIWGSSKARQGLTGFLLYWALLSLGPLLLGLSLLASTYLISAQVFDFIPIIPGLILAYLPFLFTFLALTLLYYAVPNYKVPFKPALIGGVIIALVIEMAKSGFALIVVNSSYTSIYGAFAILPLFLLWIYIVWVIVLMGAEIVRTMETLSGKYHFMQCSDFCVALQALWLMRQEQFSHHGISDKSLLNLGLDFGQWVKVRDKLLANRIITVADNQRYIILANLDQLNLWQLMNISDSRFTNIDNVSGINVPWKNQLAAILQSIDIHSQQQMEQSVLAFFKEPY